MTSPARDAIVRWLLIPLILLVGLGGLVHYGLTAKHSQPEVSVEENLSRGPY